MHSLRNHEAPINFFDSSADGGGGERIPTTIETPSRFELRNKIQKTDPLEAAFKAASTSDDIARTPNRIERGTDDVIGAVRNFLGRLPTLRVNNPIRNIKQSQAANTFQCVSKPFDTRKKIVSPSLQTLNRNPRFLREGEIVGFLLETIRTIILF